jgi:hypothetical protein
VVGRFSRSPRRELRDERLHLSEECIHGFDDGLCAICFPPKEPEPAPTAAAARAPRVGSTATARHGAAHPAAPRPRATAARAPKLGAPVDVRGTRVYHVTHVDNLGRILGAGALLADQGDPGANPAVDLAAPALREYRRMTPAPGGHGVLAEYVPFFLGVDAPIWEAVRSGTPDPRLADDAVRRPAADHVILVSSVAAALGARTETPGDIVATDSDAAAGVALAASTWPEVERMLVRLTRVDDGAGLRQGEVHVRATVPLERFALIAVGNDRVRDRVRQALSAVGATTRVAVYPPWFQAPEAE